MFAFFSGGTPGLWEILVILMIALLLFGNRLPQMARSLGKGLFEFKKGVRGMTQDLESAAEEPSEKSSGETVDAAAPSGGDSPKDKSPS